MWCQCGVVSVCVVEVVSCCISLCCSSSVFTKCTGVDIFKVSIVV